EIWKATDIQPVAADISPDSTILALACKVRLKDQEEGVREGGVVELWNLATQSRLKVLPIPYQDFPVSSVRFSPNGKYLMVDGSGRGGGVSIIDISTEKREDIGFEAGIFSPDSLCLYRSVYRGDLMIRAMQTGATTILLADTHQRDMSARTISRDGN